VESMLSAYPEIDGVLSLGGAMTRGAIDAFEEAGRELVPMCGEANNGYLKVWHDRVDQGFQAIISTPSLMASLIADKCLLR